MDKINVSSPGDSGPDGGAKINNNFIEIIKVLFGSEIWDGNVAEDVIAKLQSLPTNNKTSFLAAISEAYSKANLIDDSKTSSLVKTYSITKILGLFLLKADLNGSVQERFKVADAVNEDEAVSKQQLESAIVALIDSSPEALNTLNELATALGNDPDFATTVSTSLGNRLRFDVNSQGLSAIQKQNALTNLGINLTHVKIQGATVETSGKTDLTVFEVGDKFTAWLDSNTRYVVGKIVSLPIDFANDIDDRTKIKLVVDNII